MKKKIQLLKKVGKFTGLGLILTLLINSCPLELPKVPGHDDAMGNVIIKVGTEYDAEIGKEDEARTLRPVDVNLSVFERIDLTFANGSNSEQGSLIKGESVFSINLNVGEWTVTAKGFIKIGDTEYEAANGETSIEVTPNGIIEDTITLSTGIFHDKPGVFSYNITFPAEAPAISEASLKIAPFDPFDTTTSPGNTINIEPSTARSGFLELLPGYYLLRINATRNSLTAAWSELVHIYSGQETIASRIFATEDFTATSRVLGGTATITGDVTIGSTLTANTDNITGAATPYLFQWKRDNDNIPGANTETYDITGADAGQTITCVITHAVATGNITAERTPAAEIPYNVNLILVGNDTGDTLTRTPTSGIAGTEITLNYTVADTHDNNRLVFSGVASPPAPVESAETDTRTYTVAPADATNGVITIIGTFSHSDLLPNTIAFADTNSETRTYGDAAFTKAITNTGEGSGTITYASSDDSVATVNSSGQVTILASGFTMITAVKAADGTYEMTSATYNLTVNKKTLTISGVTVSNKTYNGNTTATITGTTSLVGIVTGDDTYVTLVTTGASASFADKTVANSKPVTITGYTLDGDRADRYILEQPSAEANITELRLTIAAPTGSHTKVYNGTNDANTAVTIGTLTNLVGGDTVNVSRTATFNSPNVLEANTITVVYEIFGTDAENYLPPLNSTITGASITKADGDSLASNPSAQSTQQTSITLNTITPPAGQTVEYARNGTSTAPTTGWQDEPTFSGLTADTNYWFFARSKANDNYNAGTARSAQIRTREEVDIPRQTVVDFENDTVGQLPPYSFTRGDADPQVIVAVDPINSGGKSLRITVSGYNQAAIVPIHLPNKLEDYKEFSFRINILGGTTEELNRNPVAVYAAGNANNFVRWGFGNSASAGNQFANLLLCESERVNFAEDAYRNKWTTYVVPIANPGEAIRNLQNGIFIAIGMNNQNSDFMLDDITFILKDDVEPILPPDPPLSPPDDPPVPVTIGQGAVATGIYRNIFTEYGISEEEVQERVDETWRKLFDLSSVGADPGTDQKDPANTRFYYEVPVSGNVTIRGQSVSAAGTGAFIYDTGSENFRATGDVRSEGMSYGMMIAVQMGRQDIFDRLWRWARTYMYNETNTGDNNRGYFSWAVDPVAPHDKLDKGPAPDGEFYFATALLFASARWGNGTGLFDYDFHARQLLYDMIHRTTVNNMDPWDAPGLFRREGDHRSETLAIGYHMPVFAPIGASSRHTDPSYHLPAFYDIWAEELERDIEDGSWSTYDIWPNVESVTADAAFYRTAAQTSRDFFPTTVNPTTGLGPDYANFNGTPNSGGRDHDDFRYDAWRIALNIGFDYAWFAKDSWQITFADRIQAFFVSQGVTTYGALWQLNGTFIGGNHSPGLVACNMAATLAASHPNAWLFVQDFWYNVNMTTGQYRYYDGCLYMMGLLHASGNFKAYLSNRTPGVRDSIIAPTTATFNKNAQQDIPVTMTLNGNELSEIRNGATVLTLNTHYTVSSSTVTINSSYLAAQPNGTTTLTFVFSAGRNRDIAITIEQIVPSSTISPTTATFDKSSPEDITVTMTLHGNTLTDITNVGTTVVSSNYTVTSDTVTLLSSYLSTLPDGLTTLTFNFSGGNPATIAISVVDPAAIKTSYDFAVMTQEQMPTVGRSSLAISNNLNPVLNTTLGVLEVNIPGYNNAMQYLEFDLGTESLASFSKIKFVFDGSNGDMGGGKTFGIAATDGNSFPDRNNMGTNQIYNGGVTLAVSGELELTLSGTRNLIGKLYIGFGANVNPTTLRIRSIELIK